MIVVGAVAAVSPWFVVVMRDMLWLLSMPVLMAFFLLLALVDEASHRTGIDNGPLPSLRKSLCGLFLFGSHGVVIWGSDIPRAQAPSACMSR